MNAAELAWEMLSRLVWYGVLLGGLAFFIMLGILYLLQ